MEQDWSNDGWTEEGYKAKINSLRSQLNQVLRELPQYDCRRTGGPVSDISGNHCPVDDPCQRCRLERAKSKLERLQVYSEGVKNACIYLNSLITKLDEAMAGPVRVAEDTELVGGFVSGLDLTETADEIVERACRIIKGMYTEN